jgi:hypothetical protein
MNYTDSKINELAKNYIMSDELTMAWIDSKGFDEESLKAFYAESERIRAKHCYDYMTKIYNLHGEIIETIDFKVNSNLAGSFVVDGYDTLRKDLRKFFRRYHRKDHPILSDLLKKQGLIKLV